MGRIIDLGSRTLLNPMVSLSPNRSYRKDKTTGVPDGLGLESGVDTEEPDCHRYSGFQGEVSESSETD